MEEHRCRFTKQMGSELELILPKASIWAKLRRVIRKLIIVSPRHHQTHRFFKSSAAVKRESKRQVEDYIFFTIHPFSLFRMYWDIAVYFALAGKMIVAPFTVAFAREIEHKTWHWLNVVSITASVILYLEIFLKFFTGRVQPQVMQVCLDKWHIFKHYMSGWFWLDLIGSAPFVLFVLYSNPVGRGAVRWDLSRADVVLDAGVEAADDELWRQVMRFLSVLYLSNVFRYNQFSSHFKGIAALLNWTKKTTSYLQFMIAGGLVLHWGACLRLFIPRLVMELKMPHQHFASLYPTSLMLKTGFTSLFNSTCPSGSLLESYLTSINVTLLRKPPAVDTDFVCEDITNDIRRFSILQRYTRSLSITTRLSLTTGFGSETDECPVQMVMTTFITFFGWIFFTVVMMASLRIMISSEVAECQYEATYNEIEVYCKAKHISKALKDKIMTYYTHKYRQNYFKERAIVKTLSSRLKREILLHTCQPLVSKVQLFKDLPRAMLQEIMKCLILEIYLAFDVILHAGAYGDCMFFIATGTAAVYSADGQEISHLSDGDHFGEISLLLKGQKRTATVIAIETCEIYRLDKNDFDRVVQPHTDLYKRMQYVAEERLGVDHKAQRRQSVRILESFIN